MEIYNEYYELDEAISKGTVFADIYMPFKRYTNYTLTAENERQELLNEVMMYDFILLDLNLALDLDDKNEEILKMYNEMLKEYEKSSKEYERMYGPLTANYDKFKKEFTWINNPWPWEVN